LLVAAVPVVASSSASGSGIGTDRSKIAQLEQRISLEGSKVQALVARYDLVANQLDVINAKIASSKARLAKDQKAQAKAATQLQSAAIAAYVSGASGNSATLAAVGGNVNANTAPARQVYLNVASGGLTTAVASFQIDQHNTLTTETVLHAEQASTTATLNDLASAREAANAAVQADQSSLDSVNANLLKLVNAALEQRRLAAEREEEARLAEENAAAQQVTTTAAITAQPTPGSYANPLRSISGLSPERIDMGVDFGGYGPLYAVGDGVVLSAYNGGWPGGTFISYRLTDGPANGLVVYAAEDIEPRVQVGQSVGPSTVIGQMYEGYSGIETGWAEPSADGVTMAAGYGQFYGSNTTAFGYNFSQLLQSLGGPGGVSQNSPPSGSLPAGWPTW
jgi:murein DD-endopeptidase MepM/ murein hydrolase activator NlpD